MAVSVLEPAANNIVTGVLAFPSMISALAIRDTSAHDATTDTPGTTTFLVDLRALPGSREIYVNNQLNQAVTLTLEYSFDGVNVSTVGNSVTVAASTKTFIDTSQISQLGDPFPYLSIQAQCSVSPTSGTLTVSLDVSNTGGQNVVPTDANTYPLVSLGTLIAGEDLTHNVMRVEQQLTYAFLTSNTTLQVKNSGGYVGHISIPDPGSAWVIAVYDGIGASGSTFNIKPGAGGTPIGSFQFNNGLYLSASGTTPGSLVVGYR